MGADGHIAIYDADKVRAILAEVNAKHGLCEHDEGSAYFCGYWCDWTCNGRHAAIGYYGDNVPRGWGSEGCQLADAYGRKPSAAQREFAARISAEATLVEDQEVWT